MLMNDLHVILLFNLKSCFFFIPVYVAGEIFDESNIPEVLVQSGILQFQPRDHEST